MAASAKFLAPLEILPTANRAAVDRCSFISSLESCEDPFPKVTTDDAAVEGGREGGRGGAGVGLGAHARMTERESALLSLSLSLSLGCRHRDPALVVTLASVSMIKSARGLPDVVAVSVCAAVR